MWSDWPLVFPHHRENIRVQAVNSGINTGVLRWGKNCSYCLLSERWGQSLGTFLASCPRCWVPHPGPLWPQCVAGWGACPDSAGGSARQSYKYWQISERNIYQNHNVAFITTKAQNSHRKFNTKYIYMNGTTFYLTVVLIIWPLLTAGRPWQALSCSVSGPTL